jgi:hypothetical protein
VVAADQRDLTVKASIVDIPTEVENDWRKSVMKLAQAHDVSAKTVYATLHKDLQLEKKPAGWVTNMLYKETKKKG